MYPGFTSSERDKLLLVGDGSEYYLVSDGKPKIERRQYGRTIMEDS
jgi:hypothetical protein